ncbi:hypothetical protein [Croceicoccus sp. Ery15]|uniref:hypothetical protein n=1 Tax=Croceicoccus sp. Ery15 TaxID=1703338 RepID=UPI001E2FC4A2|nr:hypothetical protein [Croceicoccus sp. Ery15]
MASLIISYYGGVSNHCASSPLKSETVTTSGTSAQSTANTSGAAVASLFSDTAHYFTIADNPTASAANGVYLPANTLVWVDLRDALTAKFAAVTA